LAIAREFGFPRLRQLYDAVPDPREFALLEEEWIRNPSGPERDNLHAAQIVQAVLLASAKKFSVPELSKLILRPRGPQDEDAEIKQAAAQLDALKW
jgi:hypothetical protein